MVQEHLFVNLGLFSALKLVDRVQAPERLYRAATYFFLDGEYAFKIASLSFKIASLSWKDKTFCYIFT